MLSEPKTGGPPPTDYVERVNRAIDHVVQNLDRSLSLGEVASAAYFSPFHFHRVFRAMVGETLSQFVKRLRLERALFLMSHAPGRSLTEIALACGFSSSSDFSRCFKQRYGVPPSVFDLATWRASRRGELEASMPQAAGAAHIARPPGPGDADGFDVQLRELPARSVAYIRVLDPYRREGAAGVPGATARLIDWAEARGLADGQWLGYQWDDPEIVALEDCRYDVAVELDRVDRLDRFDRGDFGGEVGRFDFPAMRVAQITMSGGLDLELRAIQWLFGTWLPTSGFEPADQPSFEAWIGRPFAHGDEHFELHIQLPVR